MAAGRAKSATWDGAAIAASVLCLAHCLLVPLVLLLAPALGALFIVPEEFHSWAVVFAVPTSIAALLIGHQRHRHFAPTALAMPALAMMAWGAFAETTPLHELLLTVLGASMLVIAHVSNRKMASAR